MAGDRAEGAGRKEIELKHFWHVDDVEWTAKA